MRSYIQPPPSPNSSASSSCASINDETTHLNCKETPSDVTILPPATVKGLPYKRKKSHIFALTTDNVNVIDGDKGSGNPFIGGKHSVSLGTHLAHGVAAAANRKKFRSKSVVSNDPKSPYFVARSIEGVNDNATINDNASHSSIPFRLHSKVSQLHNTEKRRRASDAVLISPRQRKSLWKHNWGDLSGVHAGNPDNAINNEIPVLNIPLSPDDPKVITIRQHYYPEGGFGWVCVTCAALAHFFTTAMTPSSGFMITDMMNTFNPEEGVTAAVIIGALTTAITLFLSPVIVSICRRKSIRLIAILGGLITALGCLFTSFATQFHQLFVSYGLIVGIGISMTRDTAMIMVGQYFKKRREFVEIFLLSATGVGIALMPPFVSYCIRIKNWRFGFQSLALITFITFFLGVLYRPASLYHPQRRAILHLKSLQKRSRMRDHFKGHQTTQQQSSIGSSTVGSGCDKPSYFDISVLKSRTIQILLCGTCISAFGITSPLLLMTQQGHSDGIDNSSLMMLQTFMGLGIVFGSGSFGLIIVKNSAECMIARQYLCQASCFMLSASLLAFVSLDDYAGYLLFVWIYGFFYGGYQYALKTFLYEKVRARNFNIAWSYVQCCQSIPIMVGIPITVFLNEHYGDRVGYYLSSLCIALGSAVLFFIDAHKKRTAKKRKISSVSGTAFSGNASRRGTSVNIQHLNSIRKSIDSLADLNLNRINNPSRLAIRDRSNHIDMKTNSGIRSGTMLSNAIGGQINAELTCISEEVIIDNFLEDMAFDECITSCNKEEKYLMLSEFENNLNNISQETANIFKRRQLDLQDDCELMEHHESNCPLASVGIKRHIDNNGIDTKSTISVNGATKRRASFAGISSAVSPFTIISLEPSSSTRFIEQCPNCGDELIAEIIEENIDEEKDGVEDDSIENYGHNDCKH